MLYLQNESFNLGPTYRTCSCSFSSCHFSSDSEPFVLRISQRFFYTLKTNQNFISVFSVTPELSTALSREIEAEQQLSSENLGGAAAPAFPGFKVSTKNAEVRLTKENGKERYLFILNYSCLFLFVVFSLFSTWITPSIWTRCTKMITSPKLPPFQWLFHLSLSKSQRETKDFASILSLLKVWIATENVNPVFPLKNYLLFLDDFRVEEFYVAPAAKNGVEDVSDDVYASSGKYIDPVSFIGCNVYLF